MKNGIHGRLLNRELAGSRPASDVKSIYSDSKWIDDLDIVNELDGHDGCVNALSWSKSGNLLASGSDDQRLNIHRYLPDDSSRNFKLSTTLQTGHTANIFSVKFMPHSSDRTLVSAAGDSTVRVFDIEYSGRSSGPTVSTLPSSDRLQSYMRNGTQFFSTADTNARIYRSHSQRVKRIVTESSPYLFLSCSEDGEVRQWDLRQPSSAYPRSRGAGWSSSAEEDDTTAPPPLISYKRHRLDLNTISCSASQPHYIALGGAHLHAFLHDRRMLGRDKWYERGQSTASTPNSEHDDNLMGEATQCVRRFSPHGQRKMKRTDNGHITACKISDARPNEMIASWSGDYVYSFDLVRSPDAGLEEKPVNSSAGKGDYRSKQSTDRKRKRKEEGSVLSQEAAGRAGSKPRRAPRQPAQSRGSFFHVQYENGQSEDIAIREAEGDPESLAEAAAASMPEAEAESLRIANTSVKIRKRMFTLGRPNETSAQDLTGHAVSFTSALGFSASIIQDMDEVIRSWRYRVDPDDLEVDLQTTLRRNRESARRFVQASGTIARLLGGQLRTTGNHSHPVLDRFARIVPAPNETNIINTSEQFYYDFIKAITLWLGSGVGALVDGFSSPRNSPRFPISRDAGVEAIDEHLIPYLLRLAEDRPIPNVDASRFEVDENRQVFSSERAAVVAFATALKIPFEDLSSSVLPTAPGGASDESVAQPVSVQDRKAAIKFWGFKVARGLLLAAGEGVNHAFVDRAFGGIGSTNGQTRSEERALEERLGDIDPNEEDPEVAAVVLGRASDNTGAEGEESDEAMMAAGDIRAVIEETAEAVVEDIDGTLEIVEDDEDEDQENDGQDSSDNDSSDGSDEEDSNDDDYDAESSHAFLFRNAFAQSSQRTRVHRDVPCSSHTRMYRGHCNIKTVKDVNYYGLNDEYVVSGSDSGHLFIWDRITSRLVNILEGDGEVVNVIQGHPYEPMLAVSGIDHTIKIFSPDSKARKDARKGIVVTCVDATGFSSLATGRRHYGAGRRAPRPSGPATDNAASASASTSEPAVPLGLAPGDVSSDDDEETSRVAPTGLSTRRRIKDEYTITSRNDEDRRGGQREAYITRSMLAQLAQRIRLNVSAVPGAGGADGVQDDDDSDDEAVDEGQRLALQLAGANGVMLADDCEIM